MPSCFDSPGGSGRSDAPRKNATLTYFVKQWKLRNQPFALDAVEGRVPPHGLAHVGHGAHDERVEAAPDVALPARHGGEVGLHRGVAVALGDLRVAAREEHRLRGGLLLGHGRSSRGTGPVGAAPRLVFYHPGCARSPVRAGEMEGAAGGARTTYPAVRHRRRRRAGRRDAARARRSPARRTCGRAAELELRVHGRPHPRRVHPLLRRIGLMADQKDLEFTYSLIDRLPAQPG